MANLPVMTHQDQALYLFLALAADRHGAALPQGENLRPVRLDWGQFRVARDRLIRLRLIAFESYSAAMPQRSYRCCRSRAGRRISSEPSWAPNHYLTDAIRARAAYPS